MSNYTICEGSIQKRKNSHAQNYYRIAYESFVWRTAYNRKICLVTRLSRVVGDEIQENKMNNSQTAFFWVEFGIVVRVPG